MKFPVQITFYCKDPESLAAFWSEVLDYTIEIPPDGYETWSDFLTAEGVPEEFHNSRSAAYDPSGNGPRLHFFRLKTKKTDKNRIHLDITLSGGPETPLEERRQKIDAAVNKMIAAGAEKKVTYDQDGEYWVGMRDPEGNEFCVQ